MHGGGPRASCPHVHRGRPPLRARDRRRARTGLLDGIRRPRRRRAALAVARQSVPAERDSHRRRGEVRVLFGSCRTAAPHEPPWTLEMQLDPTGRGVDALRAHALRMLGQSIDQWPHIAVMLGDQVYADDSSPVTHKRIEKRREHAPVEGLPPELVGDFEEYCWLYHESWSPDARALVLLGRADGDDLRRPRHDRRLEHL